MSYNKLESLPESLLDLKKLEWLYVEGNPGLGLPPEVERGADAPDVIFGIVLGE